jgi:signal peptidase II
MMSVDDDPVAHGPMQGGGADRSSTSASDPSPPAPVVGATRSSLVASLGIAGMVVAVDQLSKSWARRELVDRDIDLFWTLRFHLSFNSGMAFSRGRGLGPVIGVVALLVVAGLLVAMRTAGSALAALGVGLVVGGAIGNVSDRVFRVGDGGFLGGHVVDFIDLQWWPIFNVADIAVVVGGALLVIASARHRAT